jgi:hypothetical protein
MPSLQFYNHAAHVGTPAPPLQFGIHQSVAEALGSLDEATLRAMYKRASQRLENLPSAIVSKVSGGGVGGGGAAEPQYLPACHGTAWAQPDT